MVAVHAVSIKAGSEFEVTDDELCFECVSLRFLGGNKNQVLVSSKELEVCMRLQKMRT